MTKLLFKNLLSPILVGIAVWISGTSLVKANPSEAQSTPAPNPLAAPASTDANTEQVERAKEANEIKPGDWAYQTLQDLSAKYSCSDAPNGKTLSREEFATSLNGCVRSMEELVARRRTRKPIRRRRPVAPSVITPPPAPEVTPPAPVVEPTPVTPPAPVEPEVSQQDLDRLKQLVQSFNTELQALDARIKTQDDKIATLEKQQFSTTTKLNGEVIITLSGYSGRNTPINVVSGGAVTGVNGTSGTILGDRIRLNFDTSFTGKDLLRTRLQSRNLTPFNSGVTGTNMTRLGHDGGDPVGGTFSNTTGVSLLKYNFPISNDTKIITEVIGAELNDEFYNFNPSFASAGNGSLTRFGRFNPIYRLSNDGALLGIDHKFSKELGIALAYGAPNSNSASNPTQSAGIFNGSNLYFGQLRLSPSEDLNLGLAYARTYHSNGSGLAGGTVSGILNPATGSVSNPGADNPFGSARTAANHYSFLASYKLNPGFIVSGWAGFTEATREAAGGGSASSSNYAVTLAFPDFGAKGNLLGFVFGIPPKLNSRSAVGSSAANVVNPDTSYHLEALYRLKLSDNLNITPGLLLITNPEHNAANPTEYVGTIRSTFTF